MYSMIMEIYIPEDVAGRDIVKFILKTLYYYCLTVEEQNNGDKDRYFRWILRLFVLSLKFYRLINKLTQNQE